MPRHAEIKTFTARSVCVDRPAAPLTAVQDLLGHADPATTARYTRATHDDLARFMGEPGDVWR